MHASATGSAVSRPTLMTRPKVGDEGEPHRASSVASRANMPPSMAMAATAKRLSTTSTTGTSWCWPSEKIQARIGYPMRVYR